MVYLDDVGDCRARCHGDSDPADWQRKVSGFNRKSSEERAKYDKKKVSRQAGLFMVFADIGLLALTSYIHFRAIPAIQNHTISDYGTEITIVALCICAYVIVIGILAAARGFKGSKKD